MINTDIRRTGLPVLTISLVASLLAFVALGVTNGAKAETLRSITFQVPLDVSNIHKDIQYVAPMCRIFAGEEASNANQIGAVRPDIAVDASRRVSKKISMTIAGKDLITGKGLDEASLYACTLYVKKSANGPLLTYSLASADIATRAQGDVLKNIVMGVIETRRGDAVLINTPQLKAKGASAPRKPVFAANEVRRIEGVGGERSALVQKPRGVNRNGAQAASPNVGMAVDRRTQGPEPVITNWGPSNIAHPGQSLVIEGRDFNPNGFVLQLQGENGRAINLKIKNATSSRIEAEVTDFDYTGYDGAKLVAFQRGGRQKILHENYKVVNRDLVFRGDSLWRVGPHEADYIFTTGIVNLTLNGYEFQESGTGSYRETVPLVTAGNRYTVRCRSSFGKERTLTSYDFEEQNSDNQVTWRKLADGRVLIDGISSWRGTRLTGMVDDGLFRLQAIKSIRYTAPTSESGECRYANSRGKPRRSTGSNPEARVDPYQRLVEWTLLRTTP